jgi:hypothetical protein
MHAVRLKRRHAGLVGQLAGAAVGDDGDPPRRDRRAVARARGAAQPIGPRARLDQVVRGFLAGRHLRGAVARILVQLDDAAGRALAAELELDRDGWPRIVDREVALAGDDLHVEVVRDRLERADLTGLEQRRALAAIHVELAAAGAGQAPRAARDRDLGAAGAAIELDVDRRGRRALECDRPAGQRDRPLATRGAAADLERERGGVRERRPRAAGDREDRSTRGELCRGAGAEPDLRALR